MSLAMAVLLEDTTTPKIPYEILLHILSFCSISTLKNVRLTNSALCGCASPAVFRRMLLVPHSAAVGDLIKFLDASRLGIYVTHLDIDIRWWMPINRILNRLYRLDLKSYVPVDAVTASSFALVISYLPNLVRIRVHCSSYPGYPTKAPGSSAYYLMLLRQLMSNHAYLDDREPNYQEIPPWQEALFIGMGSAWRKMQSLELFGLDLARDDSTKSQRSLATVLPRLSELEMDCSSTWWDQSTANVPSSLILMASNVTRLRVRFLPDVSHGFEDACFDIHVGKVSPLGVWYGPVGHRQSKMLSSGQVAFPCVREVTLAGFWCSGDELLFFLKWHCPSLRRLVLEDICLREINNGDSIQPSWADFLKALRWNTNLEFIDFQGDLTQDSEISPPHRRGWLAKSEGNYSLRKPVREWFLAPGTDEECPLDELERGLRLR